MERSMSVVAALICDEDAREQLRQSLSGCGEVAFCDRAPELLDIVSRRRTDLILTEMRDNSGAHVAPAIRRLHVKFAATPILVYCALSPGMSGELLDLMHAGITGIVFRGCDDIAQVMSRVLVSMDDRSLTSTVIAAAVTASASAEGRMVIAYCVENAHRAPTVEQMARAIGVDRKTLLNWMRRAGLPAPKATVAWCRLLLAARLLSGSCRSVEHVALRLGFGSGTELRNMLRRYTALRPRDIRGEAGFQRVLVMFRRGHGAGGLADERVLAVRTAPRREPALSRPGTA
jgi:AraC-like DNA-binding protein